MTAELTLIDAYYSPVKSEKTPKIGKKQKYISVLR